MRWLYLYFPHLYAETWSPDFRETTPIALIQENGSVIVDANASASDSGVDTGMLLNTAFCLCPTLQVLHIKPHKQTQAIHRAAQIANRFSSWVSLDEPNGLYLEVASMKRLYTRPSQLRQDIQQAFSALGVTTLNATAPHPKAARLLARSNLEKDVNAESFWRALKLLKLDRLKLESRTEYKLRKVGLKTIYDIAKLPSCDLAYRIDADLALYLDHALGRKPWRPSPFTPPSRFKKRLDLEQEFESLQPLLFYLAKAIKEFCLFLQERCLISQSLEVRLIHRHQPPTLESIRLAQGDNRPDSWLYILNKSLERIELSAPVVMVELFASNFEEAPQQSEYLFAHFNENIAAEKTRLLNRLAARLGSDHVHFLSLTTDHRPELKTQQTPLPALVKHPRSRTSPQPVWLLPSAPLINIESYKLLHGPLRIDSGWWDKYAVKRDYYVAVTPNNSLHWIFHTPEKQWFRHGFFS
ncbi:Y-family DNA polymerase [Hahella sp. HN01]|uniref:Y-family DNA polymerase n=1 Tax=unclassified Hahella TaxID=2624107 RepID=UPI001C1ECCCD|nr:DNA polymerase Y family protein [Hahella sp. HN01]MBU6954362.1 DNA polymerase Y family protein [Hahella sp. HN01]